MNENAEKWVEALRSGEFEQCTGALYHHAPGSYCCLGVACELYRQEFGGEWKENIYFLGKCAALPMEVKDWIGLKDELGHYEIPGADPEGQSLADQNDSGWTFIEIADEIEREPDGLFA